MRDNIVQDLRQLLDAENAAIINGDFHVLDSLAADKSALFQRLHDADIRQTDLRRIARDIQKNQTLLGAAITGVAAARARILALRDVRHGLQVYDHTGQFANLPVARSVLLKKA